MGRLLFPRAKGATIIGTIHVGRVLKWLLLARKSWTIGKPALWLAFLVMLNYGDRHSFFRSRLLLNNPPHHHDLPR